MYFDTLLVCVCVFMCAHACMCIQSLGLVQLFVAPWTVMHQAPLSMRSSKQECWHGLPFPSPGDLPDPENEPCSLESPTLAGGFCTTYEAQITYHSDSLMLSSSCAPVSSAISSFHLVPVLAERWTYATFWIASSPKSSWCMSLAAGRINFSPLVKGFLALTLLLAVKNDALSADTFDEVVAFNNCFWFSCSCFFFGKTPKAYLLMQGA